MGTIAIRQSREILDNVVNIIAIELLCATQACDLINEARRNPLMGGKGTRVAYQLIREHIPHLKEDRELYKEIGTMVAVMRSGALVEAVESAIGEMKGYA